MHVSFVCCCNVSIVMLITTLEVLRKYKYAVPQVPCSKGPTGDSRWLHPYDVHIMCKGTYVTFSCELGNKSQWQMAHLVGINSTAYFYQIQSELFYLKAVELPFNNWGLRWMDYYYKRNQSWKHNNTVCAFVSDHVLSFLPAFQLLTVCLVECVGYIGHIYSSY